MTEDEMVGWHQQLNGHEFGWYAFWNASKAPEGSCSTFEVCSNAKIYMQHLPHAGSECYSFSSFDLYTCSKFFQL